MAFVPAICSQCGAKLKVDDSKEAGVCEYCGTPFVTEKAIKNYTTNITNNYNGANINMQAGNFDNYLELSARAVAGRSKCTQKISE